MHALVPLPGVTSAELVDNPYKMYAELLCGSMPEPIPSFVLRDEFWRSPWMKRRGVTAYDGPYEPWVFEKGAVLSGSALGSQVLQAAGYKGAGYQGHWDWFGTGSLLEHMRALWPIAQAAECKLQGELAAIASPATAAAPAARERSVEELRKLQVRMALKVGLADSGSCLSVQRCGCHAAV